MVQDLSGAAAGAPPLDSDLLSKYHIFSVLKDHVILKQTIPQIQGGTTTPKDTNIPFGWENSIRV